jgi:hypothetical protein
VEVNQKGLLGVFRIVVKVPNYERLQRDCLQKLVRKMIVKLKLEE